MRIIGGLWKRSKLSVLDRPGLRPTPDRVRETLFNWLGQDLSGWRCLDAFAGSGALAFEAASRGAKEVLACETDAAMVEQLLSSKDKLKADGVLIQRANGVNALLAQAQLSPQQTAEIHAALASKDVSTLAVLTGHAPPEIALALRQLELSVLAAPALPAPLKGLLGGVAPAASLREALERLTATA